jgi:uncharacterized protein YigA (DUF484 family)
VTNTNGVQGITEQDIADFLANNPGFFERHAELLGTIQLTSPHGQRAVSLQERQMEMLRDRIRGLEMKIVEMIRHGQENVAIADRLHRWTRRMLLTTDAAALPQVIVDELRHQYLIPQAAIRVWGVGEHLADHDFARAVSADAKAFASSLTLPYCGANNGFEAAGWLEDAATIQSLALVPLRQGDQAFGMLVLGSPDPTRYSADMGTEFLVRVGELAGAALSRLRVA